MRAEERQRRRFSEVIAQGVADPRLCILMSMRSDFLGELQKDEPLYKVRRQIDVPPLREAELHEVVSRPAELLSARFETAGLVDLITRRTAEDSVKDVGALPLLSYTLDDMWTQMVKRDDGMLRLPAQSFELGGVLVNRADAFLAAHPNAEDQLRRIFTLKLATVREGEEPTRRRALRSEFTNEEWRLVNELADHPNRLLVTATPEGGETYAEAAHETIFRRWGKLREWIAAEREFLAWKTALEAARRAWQGTPDSSKDNALLMGVALAQAQSWLAKRSDGIPKIDREFVVLSSKAAQRRRLRRRALIGVLALAIVIGIPTLLLVGMFVYLQVASRPGFWDVSTSALTEREEQALKPGDTFQECATCPSMVVVPAGSFMMGSPENEPGHLSNEGPQRRVAIARPFAVGKFEVTFGEFNACAAHGGCKDIVSGLDRGRSPKSYVSWEDGKRYVAWIAKVTGKPYRLLTEAEWEYAARAGKQTAYSWGDEIGAGNARCAGCGTPYAYNYMVGQLAPNEFGLYDMHGSVWEWVEDCYHDNYSGAPTDGSAWTTGGGCGYRVARGGSYKDVPDRNRSATRNSYPTDSEYHILGFRVGRTLNQ